MITINEMDTSIEVSLGCAVVATFHQNTPAMRRAAAHVAVSLTQTVGGDIDGNLSLSMREHLNKACQEQGFTQEQV